MPPWPCCEALPYFQKFIHNIYMNDYGLALSAISGEAPVRLLSPVSSHLSTTVTHITARDMV